MKILARTSFKHGRVAFDKGVVYEVPKSLAAYFYRVGWVEAADREAQAQVVDSSLLAPSAPRNGKDLEVQNGTIG